MAILEDKYGNQVATPEFVNFDPTKFYVNLQQALQTADDQGKKNIQSFLDNFNVAETLAKRNLESEISGLESFVPRATRLIRQADTEGNKTILQAADVFDARNEQAVRRATEGNVALRKSTFDSTFPNAFAKINERLNTPLVDNALKETAVRSVRNQAADFSTAGGYGVNSAAGRNLIDRFDFNKRLELDALNRDDARLSSQEAFNAYQSVIAPGILDFQPLQAQPRVTDIGAQIKPTPAVDAGSIQRNINSQLTPLNTLSPTTALQADLSTQEFNRNMDLEALTFEQEKFNTIAAGQNNLFDKTEQYVREGIANDQFNQGLDARQQSELIQGLTAGISTLIAGATAAFGGGAAAGAAAGAGGAGGLISAIFGGGGAAPAEIAGQKVVASAVVPTTGAPGYMLADGTIVPASSAGATGGAAASSPGLASVGVPLAMTAVALATGKGLKEVYDDFQDGNVDATEVKNALAAMGAPGNLSVEGINSILGSPVNKNDLSNAMLLSNPITAPVAVASMMGIDVGFGSGKSEEQQIRDQYRAQLKENEVVSNKYTVKLDDGSTFDIGKDGNAKLENLDGTTRHYYDVDFSNENSAKVVGWTNPLSVVMFNDPNGVKMTGHITNAVTNSNPKDLDNSRLNAKGLAQKSGISYAEGVKRLDAMKKKLPPDVYKAYKAGWYDLYFGN